MELFDEEIGCVGFRIFSLISFVGTVFLRGSMVTTFVLYKACSYAKFPNEDKPSKPTIGDYKGIHIT